MNLAFFLQWLGGMDFLYITKYGNTLEAYAISIAIFVASLVVWRWTYGILRRTFCERVFNVQNVFDKQSLYRLINIVTWLIPIAAFYFAQKRLFFERELSTWFNVAVLVLGQIVFILMLANLFGPIGEVILIRAVRDVNRRDQKYLQTQKQSIDKTKKHIRLLAGVLLILIPGLTIASNVASVPMVMWLAPGGIVGIELSIYFTIVRATKRSLRTEKQVDNNTVSETLPSLDTSGPFHDRDLELKETIVRFFLYIYKHRLKVLQESPGEIRLIDSLSFAPNYIYELRVMKDGDWQSRRMTIGPIGEEAGSRSKCFYVIYDYHLVIKVPPIPINDLTEYMDILKSERRIVNRLSMKECIIPSAGVILKLIQPFEQKSDLPSQDKEDEYLKFLNIFSELQTYLRIGDSFVFFMDLSKYYFLSHIIQAFHDTEKKVYDEVKRNSEVVGDYRKFEDRYGSENISFFLHIERLYKEYESALNTLIKQCDLPSPPSLEQVKTWFFIHLVGERIKQAEEGVSAKFIVGVNRLLDGIVNENLKDIQAYRDNVRKSIHHTAFVQNKGYMEGIIANLLELLGHLYDKKVAMRDLKPDNMLVAGDKDKYPGFLAYPQEYKIGLIDVETAVILREAGNNNIEQPPLGGTPQYATPSHFISNTLLARLYDDLSTILHLQDWYAIVAIIYRVVIGLPLFQRTGRVVTGIIEEMRAHKGKEQEQFPTVSEAFWSSAASEFNEKTAQNHRVLKSVNVHIRDGAKKMFKEIASDERRRLADEIEQRVTSPSMSMSAKDRQLLISSSHQKIKKVREKWESKSSGGKRQIDMPQIIFLLRDLEGLKFQLELQAQMLQLLEQLPPTTSAHTILEFMFNLVANRMHGRQWGCISSRNSPAPTDFAFGTGESSSQTTIAVTPENRHSQPGT